MSPTTEGGNSQARNDRREGVPHAVIAQHPEEPSPNQPAKVCPRETDQVVMLGQTNRRILLIDDLPAIHDDFRKILCHSQKSQSSLGELEEAIFGKNTTEDKQPQFRLDSAFQGQEGLALVEKAMAGGQPYALAFVDVRMPPGWDGVETIARIWQVDPDVQVVICTAYADCSWDEMLKRLGRSDRLLILKKPFDNIEVLQLANALTEKWNLLLQSKSHLAELEQKVAQRTSEIQAANARLQAEVSERQRAEQAARMLSREAAAASRAKSEFLANMSHEIRTPMNAVIGTANLLLDTVLDPEQRDFVETIQTSGEALLGIINDILDFSKIEAGKMTLETLNFDLREMVENACELGSASVRTKDLEVTYLIEPEVPLYLRGDASKIRQILVNLIGNAVKFTSRGEVVVEIVKRGETEKEVQIRFAVRDTGIGISEEAQRRLFQLFEQADSSTTRQFGGTGLGLAICRKLVDLMQGEIGVRSELGAGATFWFVLRLEKQLVVATQGTPAVGRLAGARILIVDDNATNRTLLRHQALAWRVAHTETAASGPEALAILRRASSCGEAYHLALLDMQMPEMDGLALARQIKSDSAIAQTHLILLSSMGQRLHARELKEIGIEASLLKPVKQKQLLSCVTQTMAQGGSAQPAASVPAERAPGQSAGDWPPNASPLKVLVAEDNPVNQKLAVMQLRKLGHRAEVAASGLEVLDALEQGQYDVILMDCHMPHMDGYEATRKIREMARTSGGIGKPVYIVALTADVMEESQEKCRAAGMDSFLTKPVRIEDLRATLASFGGRAGQTLNSLALPAEGDTTFGAGPNG